MVSNRFSLHAFKRLRYPIIFRMSSKLLFLWKEFLFNDKQIMEYISSELLISGQKGPNFPRKSPTIMLALVLCRVTNTQIQTHLSSKDIGCLPDFRQLSSPTSILSMALSIVHVSARLRFLRPPPKKLMNESFDKA